MSSGGAETEREAKEATHSYLEDMGAEPGFEQRFGVRPKMAS